MSEANRPRTINQAPPRPIEVKGQIRGIDKLKARDARWYLPEFEAVRAEKITAVANRLWDDNRARRDNYARYWGLYSNLPLPGLTPRRMNQRMHALGRNKLSLNGIQSAADTYVSKITSQRPRVSFST